MSKKLNEKDYRTHLKEQISFLQSSAKLYDFGTEIEAKRMAVALRVLVYGDNEKSQSQPLLGQMQLKKKMDFLSTARPYDEKNLLTEQLLLHLRMGSDGFTYLPAFEESGCNHMLKYPKWSSEVVLTDKKHRTYRRKDIIKLLANKDGGAHVDATIPESLAPMKEDDYGGWETHTADGKISFGNNNPVYATMRQMTFEVLQSLYKVRPQLFDDMYF